MSDIPATMTLEQTAELASAIRAEVGKAVVGMDQVVDHLLIALIAQGHVLMEGPFPALAEAIFELHRRYARADRNRT